MLEEDTKRALIKTFLNAFIKALKFYISKNSTGLYITPSILISKCT